MDAQWGMVCVHLHPPVPPVSFPGSSDEVRIPGILSDF